MLSSTTGVIHFAASVIALLSSAIVLAGTKGSLGHKRTGYVYAAAMLVVLVTSFMIYRLHGSFGLLHWFAVVSSITLLLGMLPLYFKYPRNYMGWHLGFMYWSAIGLYCAFFAETLTRLPRYLELSADTVTIFYSLIGVATAIVGGIGSVMYRRYEASWYAIAAPYQPSSPEGAP